jgi:hypothetical protein
MGEPCRRRLRRAPRSRPSLIGMGCVLPFGNNEAKACRCNNQQFRDCAPCHACVQASLAQAAFDTPGGTLDLLGDATATDGEVFDRDDLRFKQERTAIGIGAVRAHRSDNGEGLSQLAPFGFDPQASSCRR